MAATSRNKTFSRSESCLKVVSISSSVYFEAWKRYCGPSPVANQCALTDRILATRTKCFADIFGSDDLSHFLTICGDTQALGAKDSGVGYPPVHIARLSRAEKVGIRPLFGFRDFATVTPIFQVNANKFSLLCGGARSKDQRGAKAFGAAVLDTAAQPLTINGRRGVEGHAGRGADRPKNARGDAPRASASRYQALPPSTNTPERTLIRQLGNEVVGESHVLPTPLSFDGLEKREVVIAKPVTLSKAHPLERLLPFDKGFLPAASAPLCRGDFHMFARIHKPSLPFFPQTVTGNSTGNEGKFA